MAELTVNLTNVSGTQTPVTETLTTSDTVTWDATKNVLAHLDNVTGGSITVTLDGADGTTVSCAGLGDAIDVSAGYDIVIPAGEKRFVMFTSISSFLQGAITVASTGAGVESTLYKL
ncbi:MAG: hypothetical protein COA43_14735 [Robiginitomaculum sp.]|nr:MAG: hypothetical protein COA43_14735 [Robiginitomaculum sp.]